MSTEIRLKTPRLTKSPPQISLRERPQLSFSQDRETMMDFYSDDPQHDFDDRRRCLAKAAMSMLELREGIF
ncbi:hypothetical protein EYF80_000154 [Liparis tanakae]|uniref:Uncharacterized protein n=1 Tax=Liparis tanakae TaxID=230148 RepID=A0A4Z2JI03_9TELE|nr:hypothetical protein EYF80_000154 [Liparis tanakae]